MEKQYIENTISEDTMPVNCIAMANRLIEILKEGNTNCVKSLTGESLLKFKKCLWLLNALTYGQMAQIDMTDEWSRLNLEIWETIDQEIEKKEEIEKFTKRLAEILKKEETSGRSN